jgi:hypothetical protein
MVHEFASLGQEAGESATPPRFSRTDYSRLLDRAAESFGDVHGFDAETRATNEAINHWESSSQTSIISNGSTIPVAIPLAIPSRREIARRDDHVGRIGGKEFLMVVPNCDLNTLRECAEHVRSFISDLPFATSSGPSSITVSIGGTIWSSEHPLRSESLHKMVDYALYRVKHKGRNGVDTILHPHSIVAEQTKKAG